MPRYEIFLKAGKVFHKCFLGVLGLVIRRLTCLIPKWSRAQLSDSIRNKLHAFSKRKKGLKQFCCLSSYCFCKQLLNFQSIYFQSNNLLLLLSSSSFLLSGNYVDNNMGFFFLTFTFTLFNLM